MKKSKYPLELKQKILEEYTKGQVGYKQLARKYDLYRELVRGWVQAEKRKAEKAKEEEAKN